MEYSDEDGTHRINFFEGRIAPQCNIDLSFVILIFCDQILGNGIQYGR
jgi:hypothetical protein